VPRNVAATRASGSVDLTPTYARPLFLYVFESCFQLRSLFRLFIQLLFFLLFLFSFLLFLTLVLVPLAAFVTHCVHPFLLLIIFSPHVSCAHGSPSRTGRCGPGCYCVRRSRKRPRGLSGQKEPTARVSRLGWRVSMVFAITPDLRYIKDPALDPDTDSIWVFGLRVRGAL